MNLLEAEDIIKGLPDDALMQESEMPTGQLPQFLLVSEIQRRSDMRNRYAQQMREQPQGTVADQIKQQGIMSMMPQMGMPQMGMPPQMMSAGGIVRLKNGGSTSLNQITGLNYLDQISAAGADPTSPFAGMTVREQIDQLFNSAMSYPQILSFISNNFYGRPEALEYAQSKLAKPEPRMPPATREMLDRPAYESKEARMPMLAGGSDIYDAPLVLRAAKALGLFDSYKSKPEPERMAEPMASALAGQFEAEYATPDLSQRLTADMLGAGPVPSRVAESYSKRMAEPMASALARQFEAEYGTPDLSQRLTADMLTGADPVPSRVPEGTARPIGGPMANMMPPEYDQQVAERRAGIGEFFGDLSDRFAEGRARDREFIAGGYGRSMNPGRESAGLTGELLELAQRVHTDASGPRPPLLAAGNKALVPYTDYESVMTVNDAISENGNFDIFDSYFEGLMAGDKTAQGASPIQVQGKPSTDSDTTAPDFSIADLLADQRRMTQANMLMQLGAGISSGSVAKGLAAAGEAGMKGAAAEQSLALKQRLAKYQAGREDIARADKSKQFYDQLALLEKRYDNELQQSASVGQRELFRTVTALVEAATGEVILPAEQKQALVENLMNKYLNLYAPSFGVTNIPTFDSGTQTGATDFYSLVVD